MSLAAGGRRAPVEMTPEQIEQELRGYIAPALRRVKPELMQRRVTFVAKDGSTKPGVYGDALKGLATAHELEHTPAEGQRPKSVACELCGRLREVGKTGPIWRKCKGACPTKCACGATLLPKSARQAMRARREPLCFACARKTAGKKMRGVARPNTSAELRTRMADPARRDAAVANMTRGRSRMSYADRSAAALKGKRAMSADSRAMASRHANAKSVEKVERRREEVLALLATGVSQREASRSSGISREVISRWAKVTT